MIGKMFSQLRIVVLTVSMLLIQLVAKSQIEVSVPFDDGFVGLIGNNTQQATNIQRFSTLTVARAFFVQTTTSGRFENQGNDITGTLRLQLNNGNKINIPGALVWRINSGNTIDVLGFVANSSVNINLNSYNGPNYAIVGGTATGKSNFGFKLNNSIYTLQATGNTESGNAASISVSLLNNYLDALPRVLAPAPVNFALNTLNQNPGDFSLNGFNSSATLLCAVGLVNPPAGTTFNFTVNTGLTLSTGYSSWTGLTRVSFTGTQANINAALASLSVSTGTTAGNINISVSATVNESGMFYNPVNGHYYKPISGNITYANAKTAAASATFKGRPGYLVTITSQTEQDFINSNTTQNDIWIALTDVASEGNWRIDAGPEEGTLIKTQNGQTAGNISGQYNNWCSGEPNDWGSGEDYAVTKWSGGTCWNDLPGVSGQVGGYLVEFGTWINPDDQAFTDFYSSSTTYTATCPVGQTPGVPLVVSQGTRAGSGTVQLVVNVPNGTTADWYAASTGGNVLAGGTGVLTFTTPVISSTTNFYAQTRNSTTGCLSAMRTLLTANVSTITSFTPTTAKSGETITINGNDFLGTTGVKIGGVDARSFTIVSATQITAIVPANATLNTNVSITNPDATNVAPGFIFSCASNALQFDGVDDFVQIGAQLPLTSNGNFTIEAWVKPTVIDNQYHGFFGMQGVTRAPSMWVGPNGSLHTDSYGATTRFDMLIDNFFTVNKWTHVAWVKNGTTYTVYKNGVQVATRTAPASVELPTGNFWLGKVDNFLVGALDEVRVWNTAKTAQEITTNLGLEYNGNETGLTAYYNFNQGTAAGSNTSITTLNNLTAGANLNGTLTNMARTGTTSNFVTGVGPVIITQPVTTLSLCNNVTTGNTLTVNAVGQQLTYQWFSNTTNSNTGGTPITGATSSTFTAPSATAATTYYYVIVSSACNSVTETSTVSTVTVAAAVAGTATISNRIVCNGATSPIITFRPSTNAGYQWMTLNAVSSSAASGVGQNGITVSISHSRGGMVAHTGMYSPSTFPAEYSVPATGTQIRNDNSGIFTATFSQPVRDPLVAFASVGNPSNPVPVIVSAPFTPIWSNTANGWNTTYDLANNKFTGNEGFNIIRVDGLVTSVSFNYTVAEVYSTIAFGFVDQNTTYSWTNDNTSIGLAASGTGNLPAFNAINNGTTPVTANITVTPTSASGCAGTPQTFTITVNPSASITFPSANYSFERTKAITPIQPTVTGVAVSNYAISPTLPTGMTFNTTTGVVSGTPSELRTPTLYTVTTTSASGCNFRRTFTFEVFNAVIPSALSYAPASQTVRLGTAITSMVPSASGGVIASYSINPALPAGLTFNSSTGVVSGTLTAQQTGTVNYTITATNSGGSTTASVTLIYNTAPTNILLSTNVVTENATLGTTVGTLSATDVDAGDTHTYTLVSGTGSTDNASFTIFGSTLRTAAVFDFETKSSYSVRVRVTDAGGLTFEKVLIISVTDVNEAPTNISASASSVAENAASGTSVATFSATDIDAGDTFTYTLVSGTGDTDNASFAITGSTLTTAAVFDFETKSSYSVRVRVTDAAGLTFEKVFTISVTDVNDAPTNISASASSVAENAASGTTVATLSATDADAGDTFTYTLVSGTGDTDNASFAITGSTLTTAAVFDFETKSSYSVRVRVTDAGGLTFEKVFTISVTDVNDAPTNISLSANAVAENAASGTPVATLSATDADAAETFTYTLVSGTGDTDNASFTITGNTLSTAAVFDFETKSSYSVRVRVTDAGGLTFEKVFTISVTDVNDAPTNISASASSVAENSASGTTVATLSATDADAAETFTYTLVSGTGDTDNASFSITGNTLTTAAVFDFETKSSYSVRVRVTDAGGLTFEKVFTITVTDVNEAPTALALSNASVLENAASGTTVGTLAGTDADAGDTHTYTLVSGTGSTDNASFTITGTTLSTAAVFNFEAKNSYAVRVRVTDAGGLTFERAFTISVTDVNEAPTLTAITDRRVYNVSTSQVVNLAGITAGPETAQSTTTTVSTDKPATFSSINVVGTQIQFTLAAGIVTPQDVVVTVRVKDNGGVANGGVDTLVRTFKLGIDPMPVAAASPNLITLGATAQLSATGANAINYTWVAVGGSGIVGSGATINVRPKGTTTYAVVVTNSFGYQATIPVLLTVIVDYKLVPNNLVTPNGDGVNDKWVIPNIDMYPDNEVMVYDKAGRAVFSKRGYSNEWDGTVNGKLLKEDAYFYVIKFNKDGALPIRGYVSIVR
jgi:gliding motility-associated-like protein